MSKSCVHGTRTKPTSAKTGPVGDRIQCAMQIKPAHQIEQSRRFSEIEDAVKMKLLLCSVRQGKLSFRHKKWGVTAKSRCLYLDESLSSIGLE